MALKCSEHARLNLAVNSASLCKAFPLISKLHTGKATDVCPCIATCCLGKMMKPWEDPCSGQWLSCSHVIQMTFKNQLRRAPGGMDVSDYSNALDGPSHSGYHLRITRPLHVTSDEQVEWFASRTVNWCHKLPDPPPPTAWLLNWRCTTVLRLPAILNSNGMKTPNHGCRLW